MDVKLEYQSGVKLSPAQRRAGVHLLVWAVTVWVGAAFIALCVVLAFIGMIIAIFSGLGADGSFLVFVCLFSLPGLMLFFLGQYLLSSRAKIAVRSPTGIDDGIKMISVILLLTILVTFGIGLFILQAETSLIALLIWFGIMAVPLGLVIWTRRQLHVAERELWREMAANGQREMDERSDDLVR